MQPLELPGWDRRGVVRVAAALAFLLICLWPLPAIGQVYSSVFCGLANALLHGVRFASDRSLRFAAGSPELLAGKANPYFHVIATVASEATGRATRFALNLRPIGYVPSITFIAIAFAWPGRTRKLNGLRALGFGIVQAWVLFSVSLPVVLFLANDRVRAVELGPAGQSVVRTLFEALVVPPAMSYAAPAVIWLFCLAIEPWWRDLARRVVRTKIGETSPEFGG